MAAPDRRYRNDSVPLNTRRHGDFYQDTSKNNSENWDCSNNVTKIMPDRRYRNDSVPLNTRRHGDFYQDTSKNNSIPIKKQRYNTPTRGNSHSSEVGNVPRTYVTNQQVDMVIDMIISVLNDPTAAGEIKSDSAKQQVKTTVTYSVKSGVVSGALMIAGGLLGGPAGLAVGGAFGVALSYFMTKDKFKPIPKILKGLPREEQKKLCLYMISELRIEISKFTDSKQLIKYVKEYVGLPQTVADLINTFLSNNPLLLQ